MSNRLETLSAAEARRLALAAQGFDRPRPRGRIDRRHLRGVLDRVGVVQIDSVNIVARSHELPLYARLGDHPRNSLVAAAHRGEVFEYWGHEASFIPVDCHPLFRHRMAAAEAGAAWSGLVRLAATKPHFVEDVFAEAAERGPLSAGELSMGGGRTGPWWGWNDAKKALEWLFWCGRLSARRRPSFEREYALPERIVPASVLALPTPDPAEQRRELLVRAARSLGVGTVTDLADYFRIKVPVARPLLDELVEDGRLQAVEVDGWRGRGYLWPGARLPRRITARALLSPFDSMVWERDRTERLFGFRYRLEFYTPAAARTYGYYVMPFLLGDALPARVDLKADRQRRRLLVLGAFAEPTVAFDGRHRGRGSGRLPAGTVAEELAAELSCLAGFLGLDGIDVTPRGDLSPLLAAAIAPGSTASG